MEVTRPFKDYFQLHEIGKNSFKTNGPIMPFQGIAYGGHLLSAAVKAAILTLPSSNGMTISSVHSSYIRPARPDAVTYEVVQTKDGQVFSQRDVVCKQGDKIIFKCSMTFHSKLANQGGLHLPYNKDIKPLVPSPTDANYTSPTSRYNIYKLYSKLVKYFPLCFCFLPPSLPATSSDSSHSETNVDTKLSIKPLEPKWRFWAKSKDIIKSQDQNEHRLGIIFGSDAILPGTILSLYPLSKFSLVASLNHTVWFENNKDISIDINEWILFDIECLSSCSGITLNISRIFKEDGTLIATAVQQGYIKRAKL